MLRIRFGAYSAFAIALFAVSLASRAASAQGYDRDGARAWRYGEPAPFGYRVARKHTWEIVGGSVLGGGYLVSVVMAVGPAMNCALTGSDNSGGACDPLFGSGTPWLYLPVAGPFIALSYPSARADGGAVLLGILGTVQLAGATAWIYGATVPHYGLKRSHWSTLTVTPLLARGTTGAAVLGRF